jgi:hypothetical protein
MDGLLQSLSPCWEREGPVAVQLRNAAAVLFVSVAKFEARRLAAGFSTST